MFTGIIEGTGTLAALEVTPDGRRLRIDAPFASALDPGQSVSVSGACLTVETADSAEFSVFLAEETVDRTGLGDLEAGDRVNLERAMPADGRFDGHLVQGHVDGTTEITAIRSVGEDQRFGFALPEALAPYIVEKGSIAIDGISLTVAACTPDTFEVAIIPTTLAETTLSEREPGDVVNLEVDVLAKYVESMLD